MYKKNSLFCWKHRKDDTAQYEAMGKVVGGGKIKVTLDGNKNYTFQNLKEILLLQYMNEDNKHYFQSSTINLANIDESIFTSYTCKGKQLESFWEFCRIFSLRKSNNNLIIHILTAKKKDSSVVSQEIIKKRKNNFLSSHSSSVIEKDAIDTTSSSTQNGSLTDASKVWKRPLDYKEVKLKDSQSKRQSSAVSTSFILEKVTSAGKEVAIKSPRKVLVETENTKDHSNNNYNVSSSMEKLTTVVNNNNENKGIENVARNVLSFRNSMTNDSSIPSPTYSLIKASEVQEKKKSSLFVSSYSSTDENVKFVRPQDKTDEKMNLLQVPIHVIKSSDVRFTDEILGQGAQWTVMKAIYMGVFVAVKCIQKRKNNKLALREIAILHRLRHPFIINIMGAYADMSQMFVVMEYFESDSLFNILFDKKVKGKYIMNLENKIKIAKNIAYAIAFLHKQKLPIIHRDIKPNNILVSQEINSKLCDLGLASTESIDQSLQSTQKGNIRGTYLFLAPEILLNNNDATTRSDIWSFVCTLVELFSEKSVWNTDGFSDGYVCAFGNLEKKNIPKLDKLPIFLQCIVKQCFNYAPNMRPSIDDLIGVFEKINI